MDRADRDVSLRRQPDHSRADRSRVAGQARGDRRSSRRRSIAARSSSRIRRRDFEQDYGARLSEARALRAIPRRSCIGSSQDRAAQAARLQGAHAGSRGAVRAELSRCRRHDFARQSTTSRTGSSISATPTSTPGRPAAMASTRLADDTYGELLDRLADHKFQGTPAALIGNIVAFYGDGPGRPLRTGKVRKRWTQGRARPAGTEVAASNRSATSGRRMTEWTGQPRHLTPAFAVSVVGARVVHRRAFCSSSVTHERQKTTKPLPGSIR